MCTLTFMPSHILYEWRFYTGIHIYNLHIYMHFKVEGDKIILYLINQLFMRKYICKSVYTLLKSNTENKNILELWIGKSPHLSNSNTKDDWVSSPELMSLLKAEERFLEIYLIFLIPAYFLLIWRKTYILYLWKDDSI